TAPIRSHRWKLWASTNAMHDTWTPPPCRLPSKRCCRPCAPVWAVARRQWSIPMFERPHHQRIAHVLAALDGDVLRQHSCFFGGGTCIALRYGEYRESVDIDFLVSDPAGYRDLRQLLTGAAGINALVRPGAQPLLMLREVRADQYGLRTVVQMDGQGIKFEIVREARIDLETPTKA